MRAQTIFIGLRSFLMAKGLVGKTYLNAACRTPVGMFCSAKMGFSTVSLGALPQGHIMTLFQQPEKLSELIKYAQTFDIERNKRWIIVSGKFEGFEPFIVLTIQGLGKLDSKLVIEDEKIIKQGEPSNPTGGLVEHLTLSYLWVLGAYEVIRTLSQRTQENSYFFPSQKSELYNLKTEFERIRIPLAKFEPAKKFRKTDRHFATPGFHASLGVAWQISNDVWITRRTLSDNMLGLFEKLKA